MTINYEDLEDMYDNLPTNEKVARSTAPEGSLTDNLRFVAPRRNGAHKRVTRLDKE